MSILPAVTRLSLTRLAVGLVAGAVLLTGCGSPSVDQASLLKALNDNASNNSASNDTSDNAAPALPGGLSVPGGLSLPTGLDLPGAGILSSDCLAVAGAYATIALALLPALSGGSGSYDAAELERTLAGLNGKEPDELKPDFATLGAAARSASGKSLTEAGQILGSSAVSTASEHISAWTDAHCSTG